MNQAFHLYRLQQIDTQIDQASTNLNEINLLLAGDETVENAKHALDDLSKTLHHNYQSLKQAEFAVKEQQNKIAHSETALYSGKGRTPKELQDLQKEILSLKKHLTHLEDLQLELMMTIEDNEKRVEEAQKYLHEVEGNFAEKCSSWLGQKESLLRLLARLSAERSTITPPINQENMILYETIRKRKSGVAVTTARDGSCVVCGATIRPMELQSARIAQDLVYCSSCGRILYVG